VASSGRRACTRAAVRRRASSPREKKLN
jgi:hypothetical protein